jgi:hypothetical protein
MTHTESYVDDVIENFTREDDGALVIGKYDHDILRDVLSLALEQGRREGARTAFETVLRELESEGMFKGSSGAYDSVRKMLETYLSTPSQIDTSTV